MSQEVGHVLDYALSYAEHDLAVIPVYEAVDGECACPATSDTRRDHADAPRCKSPGKHPVPTAWQKSATTDPEQIKRWFPPDSARNLGMVCGSRFVVVDKDPRNGGDAAFDQLTHELGKLPPTVAAYTGGGGTHQLFAVPDGAALKSKLGPGVDLLHGARQILVAPSVHSSGRRYAWQPGRAPGEIEIATLPPAWLEYATRKPVEPTKSEPRSSTHDHDAIVKRARAYVAKMDPSIQGQHGSDELFAACCVLIHKFGLDDATTRRIVVDDFNPRCVPPWSDSEIAHKIRDARDKGDPSNWAPIEDRPRTQDSTARSSFFGSIDSVSKIVNNDPWQRDLATALADIQAALGRTTMKREPLFGDDTDAVSILAAEFDGPRWLVRGVFEQQTLGIVGAAPKMIKTWLAKEIGVAVATGTRVCGEFATERGVVVVFCAEDTKQSIRNRVRSLLGGAGRHLEDGQLHVRWRGKNIDVTSDEDLAWLLASSRKVGKQIALLIIDPLRDVHSGDENSSGDMSNVMRRLRALGELLGCAVLVNHHATKPSDGTKGRKPGQQLRGSGAIYGSADTVLVFTDSKGNGVDDFTIGISCEVKGRRSAGGFGLNLKIEDDAGGEAVRATWQHLPLSATPAPMNPDKRTEKQEHEDKVYAFVRKLAAKGHILTRTEIRGHKTRPIAWAKVIPALDRLIEYGRLRLDDEGRIQLPNSVQTEISGAP